jgi:hypothetical protein
MRDYEDVMTLARELCEGLLAEFVRAMILCMMIEWKRLKLIAETKGKEEYSARYAMVKSQTSFVTAQRKLNEHFPSVEEYG